MMPTEKIKSQLQKALGGLIDNIEVESLIPHPLFEGIAVATGKVYLKRTAMKFKLPIILDGKLPEEESKVEPSPVKKKRDVKGKYLKMTK